MLICERQGLAVFQLKMASKTTGLPIFFLAWRVYVKPFYAIKCIVGWLTGIYYMLGGGGGGGGGCNGCKDVLDTDQDGASGPLT